MTIDTLNPEPFWRAVARILDEVYGDKDSIYGLRDRIVQAPLYEQIQFYHNHPAEVARRIVDWDRPDEEKIKISIRIVQEEYGVT